jgi:hypothetical protein
VRIKSQVSIGWSFPGGSLCCIASGSVQRIVVMDNEVEVVVAKFCLGKHALSWKSTKGSPTHANQMLGPYDKICHGFCRGRLFVITFIIAL